MNHLSHAPPVAPRITTTEICDHFDDLDRDEWAVVGWRYKTGGAWFYHFSAADVKRWNLANGAGSVLVVQRCGGDRWVVLGRLAGR